MRVGKKRGRWGREGLCGLSRATSQGIFEGQRSRASRTGEGVPAREGESLQPGMPTPQMCCRELAAAFSGQVLHTLPRRVLDYLPTTTPALPQLLPDVRRQVRTQVSASTGSGTWGWAHALHQPLPPTSGSAHLQHRAELKGGRSPRQAAKKVPET